MTENDRGLLLLLGIYLLSKYEFGMVPALESFGAGVYDVLHNDAGHKQDLPGPRLKAEAILAIAKNAGFPDPKLAAAIALGESLGYVGAKNITPREYSVGLWQINTKVHPYSPAEMRDPIKNAAAAFLIYSKKGWQPWGAYTDGRYLQFRKGILAA